MKISNNFFIYFLSLYITAFVGFYLWTGHNLHFEEFEKLRYNVTALYAFTFLIYFSFKTQIQLSYLWPLYLYILYCALIMLSHGAFVNAGLFSMWLIVTVIILPDLLSKSFSSFQKFIKTIFYFTLVLLIIIYLYGILNESDFYFTACEEGARCRFTSGLSNPSIYSKLVATSFWLAILLFLMDKKRIYLIFALILFSILIKANMRTDLFGTGIGIILLFILFSKYKSIYFFLMFLAFIFVFIFIYNSFSMSEINSFFSGRIEFWVTQFQISGIKDNLKVVLFGSGRFEEHMDSQWLEILLKYGIFALILYFYTFIYIYFQLERLKKIDSLTIYKNIFIWGQIIWIIFGLQSLVGYIFPSFGNTYNLILLPIFFAVFCLAKKGKFYAKLSKY